MKELIRSPLQFVRPMTDDEWQDLVLRASHRVTQQIKRRLPQRRRTRLDLSSRRRGRERLLKQTDSAGLR